MAESGIYEIVNLVNGKRYVGSAVNLALRWRQHRRLLRRGEHPNAHLNRAWAKHGEHAFAFRIIETCAVGRLIEMEQARIDMGADYNICPTAGSTLGRPHSEETRRKIGAKKIGLKLPPRNSEYRAKISAAHKGRKLTPEHMAALQAGRRARVWTDADKMARSEGMKRAYAEGRHRRDRPEEYRAQIAASLTGRKATLEHRANQSAAQLGKKRGPYKITA